MAATHVRTVTTDGATGGPSIDIGTAGTDRLVVLVVGAETFGGTTAEFGGFALGGVAPKVETGVNSTSGTAAIVWYAYWTENELGSMSGSQSFTASVDTWDGDYPAIASLYTGVADATAEQLTTVFDDGNTRDYTHGGVTGAVDDLVVHGYCQRNDGNTIDAVTPADLTERAGQADAGPGHKIFAIDGVLTSALSSADIFVEQALFGGAFASVVGVFAPAAGGGPASITLDGVAATGAVGALTVAGAPAAITLDGVAATGAVGELSVSADATTIALAGVAATGAVGALSITPQPSQITLPGVAGFGALGELTVAPPAANPIRVQRTSGVAPLAVFFDALQHTNGSTSWPFHECFFSWDFDDPAGGATWAQSPSNASKNAALGPCVAHVFESPGTYTVTLTVRNPDGTDETFTETITVDDPDVVFSGTDTICFSTSGTFTGAPAGAQTITSSDFESSVETYHGSNKRLLFRAGETFSTTGDTWIQNAGPGIIGSFGDAGPGDGKFTIDHAGGVNAFDMGVSDAASGFGDWRIMDAVVQGAGAVGSGTGSVLGYNGELNDVLLLRVEATGVNAAFVFGNDVLDFWETTGGKPGQRWHDGVFIVECTTTDIGGGSGGNGVYGAGRRYAIMGCNFDDTSNGEHNIRTTWADRSYVAHNRLHEPGNIRHCYKAHCQNYDEPGNLAYQDPAEWMVFRDNLMDHSLNPIAASLAPQNSGRDEQVQNVLCEGNLWVPRSSGDRGFYIDARYITIRHNFVDGSNSSAGQVRLALASDDSPTAAPERVAVIHNSMWTDGSQQLSPFDCNISGGAGTDTWSINNLVRGSSTDLDEGMEEFAGNVGTVTNPFTSMPPSTVQDFELVSGATIAIGQADEAWTGRYPIRLDALGRERPSSGTDVGALEFQDDGTIGLAGAAALGAVGSLTVSALPVTISLDGVVGSGAVGELTVALSGVDIALSGVAATGAVGSLTVDPQPSQVALGGVAAQGVVGALDIAIPGVETITLTGVAAAGAVGSLSLDPHPVTIALDGVAAQLVAGALLFEGVAVTIDLDGVAAQGAVGTLGVDPQAAQITLTGAVATGAVGQLTFPERAVATRVDVRLRLGVAVVLRLRGS